MFLISLSEFLFHVTFVFVKGAINALPHSTNDTNSESENKLSRQ